MTTQNNTDSVSAASTSSTTSAGATQAPTTVEAEVAALLAVFPTMSKTMVNNLVIDAQRKEYTETQRANRPDQAMKAKWADGLEKWQKEVIIQVIHFLRSDDPCAEDLPYDKLASKIALPLEPDLTDEQRRVRERGLVWDALRALQALGYQVPRATATWYELNIEREFARRQLEPRLQQSIDDVNFVESATTTLPSMRLHTSTDDLSATELFVSFAIAARALWQEAVSAMPEEPEHVLGRDCSVTLMAALTATAISAMANQTEAAMLLDQAREPRFFVEIENIVMESDSGLAGPAQSVPWQQHRTELHDFVDSDETFRRDVVATLLEAIEVSVPEA